MTTVARNYRGAAVKSITNSTSTGAGTAYDLGGCFQTFSYQTVLSTAGTATATIQLFGSLDGSNWTAISAASTMSTGVRQGAVLKSTASTPVQHVRMNVNALGSNAIVEAGWIGAY
jgi:hypothetical protein